MKNESHKRPSILNLLIILAGLTVVMLGFVFSVAVQPAQAQDGYPVDTPTVTVTATPTATGIGAATATVTPTVTATRSGTLPPPARTGTPTSLVPVTGADLTRQDGEVNAGMWIAIWLVGLLLIGFGLRSRLSKR